MKNTISFLIALLLLAPLTKASIINLVPPIKKITIYWDASLSMKDKDIDKELTLLDVYFQNRPNVEVDLITFSNSVDVQQRFTIVNSNWNDLKEILLKTTYDGVAFYDVLLEDKESDMIFLFTDGVEILDKLILNKITPTFIINSTKKANFKVLIKQSHLSKGKYINLTKIDLKKALSLLNIDNVKVVNVKTTKEVLKMKENTIKREIKENIVKGIVYDSEGALVGATITVNGKFVGVVSNEKGEFSINATQGDILTISYLGKITKEIIVEESPLVEILLSNDENELDEVVVKGEREEEIIDLGYGKIAKKKLGYAVQSIGSEDLPEGRDDNISLHGKFSGVTSYGQSEDISQIVFRANSILLNVFPLILVDGIPIRRSSSVGSVQLTNFIDPKNIAKITILKGLAATNRWGSEGANGVILITTKSSLAGGKNKNSQNTALAKDNDFTENLSSISTAINEKYIDELKEFKTLNEVCNHYLKQRIYYLDNLLYFVNISDFILQFGNKEIASKILSNILELYPQDITLFKLVAYKAEQQQDFFFAKRIYEKIAKLKPRDAQSYRDLALSYQETGYYQKALDIYKKMLNKDYLGVDFSGIQKVITNEMRGLILRHKDKLDLSGIPEFYLNDVDYDARIVVEYNDNEAEFELQFVNPQKKFFSWSHTKAVNEMRLYEEKDQGFNTEEFLLVDAEKGQWQINIESEMNQHKKPIVLKYTVYKNYGKASETKEVRVIILNAIKEKQVLGNIRI
ncbi:carboxypeptidase-like regulatory domain-containing protein [Lutibacter sp.]